MADSMMTLYRCESCDAVVQEGSGEPLYQCSSCGNTFNRANGEGRGSTCPECHKFASRVADDSCSECEQGELTEDTFFVCEECDPGEVHFETIDGLTAHRATEHRQDTRA